MLALPQHIFAHLGERTNACRQRMLVEKTGVHPHQRTPDPERKRRKSSAGNRALS